jgi:hypothetical protein
VVRDLDDGGALLWIPDSKTLAGRRKLQVPETTAESYAKREAVADAQQKRALAVLTGGKLAS